MNTLLRFFYSLLLSLFCSVAINAQCVVTSRAVDPTGTITGTFKNVVNGCPNGGTVTFNLTAMGCPATGNCVIPIGAAGVDDDAISIGKRLTITGPLPTSGRYIVLDGTNIGGNSYDFYNPLSIISFGYYLDTWSPGCSNASPCTSTNSKIENISFLNSPKSAIELGVGDASNPGANANNMIIDNVTVGVDRLNAKGANNNHGIVVTEAANVTIQNSVISGNNSNGIRLINVVGGNLIGNKIGVNNSGNACLGNKHDGINMSNSSNVIIGSATVIPSNIISCNGIGEDSLSDLGKRGIYMEDSDDNQILGNYIGTGILGTELGMGNFISGILLSANFSNSGDGSDGNKIQSNIISNNGKYKLSNSGPTASQHGVVIADKSDNNILISNLIGVGKNGLSLGNKASGLEIIQKSNGNRIGGSSDSANVIAGNGGSGISLQSGASNSIINGNYIGVIPSGTVVPNGAQGVLINANRAGPSNITYPVGTASLVNNNIKNNIISGNLGFGLQTLGTELVSGLQLKGNLIGLLPDGTMSVASGNKLGGILFNTDLNGILIGGTGVNDGNYISNNGGDAIQIDPPTSTGTNNRIYGNKIGITKTNGVAGNTGNGLNIKENAQNLLIGDGSLAGANVIVNSESNGIITETGATNITVDRNFIGVLADGTTAAGNKGNGIQFQGTTNAIIQNAQIAFNGTGATGDGILITGSTSTFTVDKNLIGTVTAMTTNQANLGFGINISGGIGTISDNSIAYNMQGGINVSGTDGLLTITSNKVGTTTASSPKTGITITGGTNNQLLSNTVRNQAVDGISISGTTTNLLSGNSVRDNLGNGISIAGGTNTFDNTTAANTVTANKGDGINISGGTNTISSTNVTNNILNGYSISNGVTSVFSSTISGNKKNGIVLDGDLGRTTIGKLTAGNTITTNGENGVLMTNGATGNTVDNSSAIDGNGTEGIGSGIVLDNATGNKIGSIQLNKINGNAVHGILLLNGAKDNIINNNSIGLTVGNTEQGIAVISAGTGNEITLNRIESSGKNGLYIEGTSGTIVSSNTIGSNTGNGVFITGTSNTNTFESNNIGVTALGADNSNGANKAGIQVNGGTGNIIGTTGKPNIFGGTTQDYGVLVDGGTGTKIDFNYFGTKSATTVDVSTALNGILVSAANVASINENVFSYSGKEAVKLTGASRATTIDNNFFGVNNDGTTILAAGKPASAIFAQGAITSTAITNNIIPSTSSDAIVLDGVSSTNSLTGNKIGVFGDNTKGAGNATGDGIVVRNSTSALTISANIIGLYNNGIHLTSGTTNKTISGNFIGTDAALSTEDFGNSANGILVDGTSSNNIISANTIAYNTVEGISINNASTGNNITQNSMYCNAEASGSFGNPGNGIALASGGNGTSATKDFMSPDFSTFRPFVMENGGTVSLEVRDSAFTNLGITEDLASGSHVVEVFSVDDDCENCQGKTYLGAMTITGNNASFSSGISTSGKYVVTIKRIPSNNTSQFSACSKAPLCSAPDSINLISNKGIILDSTVACLADVPVNLTSTAFKSGIPDPDPTSNYNYTWFVDKVENSSVNTDAYTPLNTVQRKVYTVRAYSKTDNPAIPDKFKNVAGCFKDDSVNVYIYETPIYTLTPDVSLCAGDSTQLKLSLTTGKLPYSFIYTINAGAPINGSSKLSDTLWYVKPTATSTYNLTELKDKNGCLATDLTPTATVTVNPLPVITVNIPTPVCKPTTVNLSSTHNAVGYDYTYRTFTFGSTPTVVSDSGTYQIIAVDNAFATACSDTASVLVTIHSLPTLTTKAISAVCEPLQINLEDGVDLTATKGTLSYHLTQADADTKSSPITPTTVSVGATPSVTYFVRSEKAYTSPTATTCFVTDDIIATINTKPDLDGTSITGVCSPGTIDLDLGIAPTTTAGLNYKYFQKDGETELLSKEVSDSGSYVITGTDVNSCSDTIVVVVEIYSLPLVSVSSNSPICDGTDIELNSSSPNTPSGASFSWTGPNSYTDGSQNPTISSATMLRSGDYEVTISRTVNSVTCSNKDKVNVQVNAVPTPSITTVTDECLNALASARKMSTLNISGNTYKWVLTPSSSIAEITGADNTNAIDLKYNTSGTVKVKVIETVGSCKGADSTDLTIQDIAQYSLSLPAECEYVTNYDLASHTPSPISVGGATYSSGSGKFYRNNIEITNPTLDLTTLPIGANSIEYRYTLASSENSCVTSVLADLVVNPKPTGLNFTPPSPLCELASPITLNGTSTTAGTTATYSGTGVAGNQFNPDGLGGTSSTITYTATASTGCIATEVKTIVVNSLKKPNIDIIQDNVQCQGEEISFKVVEDGTNFITSADVLDWRINNPASPKVNSGVTYKNVLDNKDQLFVTLNKNIGTCLDSVTTKETVVTIKVPLIKTVEIDPLKRCLGEEFDLFSSADSLELKNTFEWYKVDLESNDTILLNEGSLISDKADKVGAFKYFIVVTNFVGSNKCTSSDPTNIVQVVDASITALAGPSKDDLLPQGSRQVQGRPIVLDARHPQDGQQYENYTWTLVSVEEKNINESVASTKQASHTPVVEDGDKNLVYKVSANIKDLATCAASDTVSVRLIGNCFVPNGFSPNGDGANDVWDIHCLTDGDYPNAIVKIYNRWGELIYKDDRGGVVPWDGTRNGDLVPIGTYYFVIDLNFEDIEQIAGAVAI